MTFRDPYTGVERPAPPRPSQSRLRRWWPAAAIALAAIVVGGIEWENARSFDEPATPAASTTQATAPTPSPQSASPAATPSATADDLARATAALNKASEQLSGDTNLLIAIAALQALVLVGQLYLFGQQRRAGRRKPD